MNLPDALEMLNQILKEERAHPTVSYEAAFPTIALTGPSSTTFSAVDALSAISASFTPLSLQLERKHARSVRENPATFQLKSTNYDLLCAVLDQLPGQDRASIFAFMRSSILSGSSFRHNGGPVLGAGSWERCSSELPLVAEFLVRRGDKKMFISSLNEAAASPGLTLLLLQLEEMIALSFTLFSDSEYQRFPAAMEGVKRAVANLSKRPKPSSTIDSNVVYHVTKEVPDICDRVLEACRKARFFYVKGSLLPGMNLEVNQDKDRVRTFLEKLRFPQLLIASLEEAEKLYRESASPFELKSSMGHLRSFLENLHLQACKVAHTTRGGLLPSKWGEALKYLREQDILTVKEEQFTAQFYTLMSDTSVHPLVADREYARLMRNISIEYGLLLLTKLDRLGLK